VVGGETVTLTEAGLVGLVGVFVEFVDPPPQADKILTARRVRGVKILILFATFIPASSPRAWDDLALVSQFHRSWWPADAHIGGKSHRAQSFAHNLRAF
jgi:hypothetical protein